MTTVKTVLAQQSLDAPEGIVAVDAATRHLWKQVRIGKARADGQFEIVWQSGHSIAPAPFPFFIPYAERGELTGERAMKISTRLLLLFLAVAVLPLALLGYFNLQQNEATLRSEALGSVSDLADKKVSAGKGLSG